MSANQLPLEACSMSCTPHHAEIGMPMSKSPPREEPAPMQDTPPPPVDSMSVHRVTRTKMFPNVNLHLILAKRKGCNVNEPSLT